MEKNEEVKHFKGYSLFVDVEDFNLRAKNRGTIIVNIVEEHYDTGRNRVSPRGLQMTVGYFTQIPPLERKAALDSAKEEFKLRGIKYE